MRWVSADSSQFMLRETSSRPELLQRSHDGLLQRAAHAVLAHLLIQRLQFGYGLILATCLCIEERGVEADGPQTELFLSCVLVECPAQSVDVVVRG